jgi:hypothetical protein
VVPQVLEGDDGDDQREPCAVGDLGQVRRQEKQIDRQQEAGACRDKPRSGTAL